MIKPFFNKLLLLAINKVVAFPSYPMVRIDTTKLSDEEKQIYNIFLDQKIKQANS